MGKLTCREGYNVMSKKILFYIFGAIAILVISQIFILSTTTDKEESPYLYDFKKNYSIYAVDLPDKMSFAGEDVPLKEFDVRESLDREILVNTYFQSQTLLFLKKAPRFLPVVEPILKELGVPEDFKYLPFVESGYANVTSPAKAVGYWQFLKGTARDYGLEVNDQIDERYHLEKSTRAACAFLKESYEKYGSWTLAAASYNMGRSRLSKELERQKADNYYDVLLNSETARYVFRLLAIKQIVEAPEQYGFHYRVEDLYELIPTKQVRVDTAVSHFADFAAAFGINYKELKHFNPWLRNHFMTNKSRTVYYINIPLEGYRKVDQK